MIPATMVRAAIVAAALAASAGAGAAPNDTTTIHVGQRAVLRATIEAQCERCAWDVEGREAVTLVLTLNGRYSQHLPLVRGAEGTYDVLLGDVEPGTHTVRVAVDPEHTARELRAPRAARVRVKALTAALQSGDDYEPLSLAPILYARPNTIGRFTDVPVFMWYEREPTSRGTRYRYTVVFTNEDGGTPTDRLMATWGRTTDIEYVYSVEVDALGKILVDDYQGPEHEILPFRGAREGRHPLLFVSTDNNMVRDTGTTRVRYAPAPVSPPAAASVVSREAYMDANPWLYAVATQELVREGKIVENAPPGNSTIPDPRRFVYIEACGELGGAALTFEVLAGAAWVSSDRGVPEYRIARDGCFRGAIPLPAGLGATDVRALRVAAHPRARSNGQAAAGPVRLQRINGVFMLDDQYRRGPSLLQVLDPATIVVGSPLEVPIPAGPGDRDG